MIDLQTIENGKSYPPLVALLKNHSRDIWNNWSANLYVDDSLPTSSKQNIEPLFRHFLDTFYSASEHLIRSNQIEFYNVMTEQWLIPNQFNLNPQITSRGLILLEKAILPLLIKLDSETSTTIINCFQDIALRLIGIIHEITNRWVSVPQIGSTEAINMVISFLDMLPVERVSFAKLDDNSLTLVETWQREGNYLQKTPDAKNDNFALPEKNDMNDNIQHIPIQDDFMLLVEGTQPFTQEHLTRLHHLAVFLSKTHHEKLQFVTLQEHISRLELIRELDEKLLRHSGPEGLIDVLNDCQISLNFKRSAFFGYSPWSKTAEGIIGLNIDQQKIQSIREPVYKIHPFKDALLTKKPVHLIDSHGDDKLPDIYVNWFHLTSLLIIPVIHDKTLYGFFLMDQKGEKFENSKSVFELSEILGLRIGTYLGRNEAATHFFQEVNVTERETDILQLLAEGLDNKHIGKTLNISEHTVRDHVSNLMIKFNAKNRAQVVACGFRHRLLK